MTRIPERWVNIHAGLDQFSPRLRSLFGHGGGSVLDIHDPSEMTEPSISRARRIAHPDDGAITADWRLLPIEDASVDVVFLIFTAHELRRAESRTHFFGEVARTLRSGGRVIVVEHLRDWSNFVAFGPGFLHFFPAMAWRGAANAAGLRVKKRVSITPFVSAFVIERSL